MHRSCPLFERPCDFDSAKSRDYVQRRRGGQLQLLSCRRRLPMPWLTKPIVAESDAVQVAEIEASANVFHLVLPSPCKNLATFVK